MDDKELLKEYYRLYVDGLVAQLHASNNAAPTWRRAAEQELGQQADDIRRRLGGMTPELEDDFGAEFGLIETTERNLYAGLAVQIATAVEGVFNSICKRFHLPLSDKAMWGEKRQAVEKHLNVKCSDLPGIKEATFGRVLGNCFKHGGGRGGEEYAKVTGGKVGDVIEYEKVEWRGVIEGVSNFLHSLTQKV